jgi:3-hydroxyisobutyrate dehydrogenase
MAKIGFIGLGNMGGPMVANLVKAGHSVAGFDIVPAAVERAVAAGATAAGNAVDAARGAGIVITMLPAGRHVRSVYLEDDRILDVASAGALLIDSSTIDVATARDVAAAAGARGYDMIDAPVSGGVGGATAGTLTFMCGGSDAAFARARPVLEVMGKNIFHAGAAGAGQSAKVCNNLMLAIEMIAVSEGFALADKLGLERQKLWDIASTATSSCWAMVNYCPVPGPVPSSPANRDYKAGFTVAMMLKDLKLARDAVASTGARSPLGEKATALYDEFAAAGNEGLDFSAIFRAVEGE